MLSIWWTVVIVLAWKSTVVLIAAGVTGAMLWRVSAAARHLVWALALGSLLILPVMERTLPGWGPVQALHVTVMPQNVSASATTAGPGARRNSPPRKTRELAFGIWMAGALVCLWRWGRSIAKVARLRRNAASAGEFDEVVGSVAAELGLRNRPPVLRSLHDLVPLAAGILRPAVLLPSVASAWPRERLRVALLHEMGHIRRRDSLTQALAELARCLYWFHPLVWLAIRRLRVERERACDDLVLRTGTAASDYASQLLSLARSLQPSGLAPAAASMAGAHLETRIRAILNPHTNRWTPSRASSLASCIFTACLVLPLAAMRPQAVNPGVVTGTVYDPAGARVPGALVIASSAARELKTTTDQEGKFSIGPLTGSGAWQLIVEAPGFAAHTERIGQNHFDITLDVGQIQENVVVHGKGASTPQGPHRVRVGGNLIPAKLVYKIDPEYPQDTQSRGVQGDVVLRAVISVQGRVLSLTSISAPDQQLVDAAMKAVREWRYQPSLLNGEPVETVTTITVNFELNP